jgi:hypothetical protein
VNYVGVLKDLFRLDYGPVQTHVIKWKDNQGNPTYVWDNVGFLMVNFRHKLPLMFEPLMFPFQATHVFFFMISRSLAGKLSCERKFNLGGR